MLLVEPLAGLGAACAFGLLGLFTAAIAINLWRGRHPACACFGSFCRSDIGVGTLARNVALSAAGHAIAIDAGGIVAEPVARGAAAVTHFLERWIEQTQVVEAHHELAPV
jgi:hypothetical protein